VSLTRHRTGSVAVARAYASQVHPVFMLPPVAASLTGATLPFTPGAPGTGAAGLATVAPGTAALHALAIFAAVYTAHLKDGYVDFHRRGEDEDHPLTVAGCRLGLALAAALFLACLGGLWVERGPLVVALTAPTWALGYLHAPHLDTNPLGATLGYPVGIALAVLGGAAAQTGTVGELALAVAGILLIVLTGIKIVDDAQDRDYDRSIDKRTVAVVVGLARARRAANALFLAGGVLVLWLTVGGPLPALAPVAPLVFGAVAVRARQYDPKRATELLVRGSYLLLALLLVAIWFRPLAAVPLPDIGVLGPYTYIATEIVFGSIALALLVRAGRDALWRAGRTIALLYPVAYVWDWYSLEVGIFAIQLRTGVGFAGLPLEEHLFALVVPALVLAIHESIGGPVPE
jgi:lycopene cyclase domain-containing protein